MQPKQLIEEKYKILETFNPTLLKQLKLVSKMSMWVALIAFVSLSSMLLILLPSLPDQYAAFTQLIMQVQNNLAIMLVLCGLLLIIGASFTTWFICLYSSFRISGPLYCFSRNLEQQTKHHPHAQINLRENDSLQAECHLYNDAMAQWISLYQEINLNNDKIDQLFQQNTSPSPEQLGKQAERLKDLITQVKF